MILSHAGTIVVKAWCKISFTLPYISIIFGACTRLTSTQYILELTENKESSDVAERGDNSEETVDLLTQSVYLHRMRLLHVVNGLHDHIMTNVC